MQRKTTSERTAHGGIMGFAMMACCAIMLVPVAGYFMAGGAIAGVWGNALVFAPLLLCVGAHLVMHKTMGRPCHGAAEKSEPTETAMSEVSVPVRADGMTTRAAG